MIINNQLFLGTLYDTENGSNFETIDFFLKMVRHEFVEDLMLYKKGLIRKIDKVIS